MGRNIRTVKRKRSRRRNPSGGLHYVTFSCFHRLPLLGTPLLRDRFVEELVAARQRHKFLLVAWVVMPDHVHIIIEPTAWLEEGSELPSILNAIKSTVATRSIAAWRERRWHGLAELTEPSGRVRYWEPGGGFDRNIRDSDELEREVRYIHRNPIKRGLVSAAIGWRWSSARWYAGERGPAVVPIDKVLFDGIEYPGPRPEGFVGD